MFTPKKVERANTQQQERGIIENAGDGMTDGEGLGVQILTAADHLYEQNENYDNFHLSWQREIQLLNST